MPVSYTYSIEPETGYLELYFSWFTSVSPGIWRHSISNCDKTPPFHVISNLLFTNQIIRFYRPIVRVTHSAVKQTFNLSHALSRRLGSNWRERKALVNKRENVHSLLIQPPKVDEKKSSTDLRFSRKKLAYTVYTPVTLEFINSDI
jgi:hypothetical protein